MELINQDYKIQNVSLLDICKKVGAPVYVYDSQQIENKIAQLRNAFKDVNLKIKYACKALSNVSILKFFKHLSVGIDAVSIQEVYLAIHAGFQPDEILFTPNCVSFEEIELGIDLGVMINIDNLSVLEHFGHRFGDKVPCCIRINPHLLAGGNQKIQTGHIDSKFGISILQLRHLLRIIKLYNIKVIGLHVHTGSDILDANTFLQGADIVFDAAFNFQDLAFIDFGSGFKVPYKEDDIFTDIQDLGEKLTTSFKNFCKNYGRELEIWFEPGKFLVSEAGYFLVKTNVIKQTPSTVFVGVDSGMNHLIRPMLYDAYHTIINLSNPNGSTRIYSIVGYICETDTFGWDRKLNEVREGDILCIKNAGAYGYSMASNYNSRLRPPEVLIHNNQALTIRKRETMDDLLKNQTLLNF